MSLIDGGSVPIDGRSYFNIENVFLIGRGSKFVLLWPLWNLLGILFEFIHFANSRFVENVIPCHLKIRVFVKWRRTWVFDVTVDIFDVKLPPQRSIYRLVSPPHDAYNAANWIEYEYLSVKIEPKQVSFQEKNTFQIKGDEFRPE